MSGDERERALLDAARSLLEQRGLAELSVDEIATGAGLSRSAFYFYFDSKEALLAALLDGVLTA